LGGGGEGRRNPSGGGRGRWGLRGEGGDCGVRDKKEWGIEGCDI